MNNQSMRTFGRGTTTYQKALNEAKNPNQPREAQMFEEEKKGIYKIQDPKMIERQPRKNSEGSSNSSDNFRIDFEKIESNQRLQADSDRNYALTRRERQEAIDEHRRTLDQHRTTQLSYKSGQQWVYDEDEENTPAVIEKKANPKQLQPKPEQASYEMKPMTLDYALNRKPFISTMRESPMQNHFIKQSTIPGMTEFIINQQLNSHMQQDAERFKAVLHKNYIDKIFPPDRNENVKIDYEELFERADNEVKAQVRANVPEYNVQMAHADFYQAEKKTKFKSRIGGITTSETEGLMVNNSKPSESNSQSKAESLNDLSTQSNLLSHLEDSDPHFKHMKEYQEGAKARKENKLSKQVQDPVVEDTGAKAVQLQLQQRQKRKQEEKQSFSKVDSYKAGDGLGTLASTYFSDKGAYNSRLESAQLKKESFEAIKGRLRDNSDDLQFDEGPINQIVAERAKNEKSRGQIFNAEIEQAKKQMMIHQQNCIQNQCYGIEQSRIKNTSDFDTIHPQKITNVHQNILLDQQSRGFIGSHLGFGNKNVNSDYQASQLEYMKKQQNQYQINNSQYQYTGNLLTSSEIINNPNSLFHPSFDAQIKSANKNIYPSTEKYIQPNINTGNIKSRGTGFEAGQKTSETAAPEKPKAFFYESCSKVISLKKFSEDYFSFNSSPFSEDSIYLGQSKNQSFCKDLSLQKWFSSLQNHEKAIVLTIVDSDLVSLVKEMHKMYSNYGHGFFQQSYDEQELKNPQRDADKFEKLTNFKLLFKKPPTSSVASVKTYPYQQKYDTYGPFGTTNHYQEPQSKVLKEQQKSQDVLISNVNIIQIGNQEALTLAGDLLENTEFFLQMMRKIDDNFMLSELKIDKTDYMTALSNSVLKNEDKKSESRKNPFFTLNERHVITMKSSADDFRQRTSQYTKVAPKGPTPSCQDVFKDKSKLSMAQILCHVFEKAINIQFQDFLNKLSNPMKEFFFLQEQSSHIYTEDIKLTQFWKNVSELEKEQIWSQLASKPDQIISDIKKTEQFLKAQWCEDIEEVASENEDEIKRQGYQCLENESSSSNDSNDKKWDKAVKANLEQNEIAINQQTARLSKKYVSFSETESDDIEKSKNTKYYSQSTNWIGEKPHVENKVKGQGIRALDHVSDDSSNCSRSRTVTENSSDDDNQAAKHSQKQMRAIYSTVEDQYASNYEDDGFEEEDPNDDFSLPRDHKQNNDQPTVYNIKEQIAENKKSVGGQKLRQDYEEQKKQLDYKQSAKTFFQQSQNKEIQKENQLRKLVTKEIKKLQEMSQKAVNMQEVYLFIRNFSTFKTFSALVRIEQGNYKDIAIFKLYECFNKILNEQHNAKIIKDLEDFSNPNADPAGKASKKNKKKKNKKSNEGDQPPSIKIISDDLILIQNPMPATEPVNETTKKKKKNRKKKKPQVENQGVASSEEPQEQTKLTMQALDPQALLQHTKEQMEINSISTGSLDRYKRELNDLVEADKYITTCEKMLIKETKKDLLGLDSDTSQFSNFEKPPSVTQSEKKNNYIEERQSFLHGHIVHDKYKELEDDNFNRHDSEQQQAELYQIGRELEEDSDVQMFNQKQSFYRNTVGIRKRQVEERLRDNQHIYDEVSTSQMIKENEQLYQNLASLNEEVKNQLPSYPKQVYPGMVMTDLLQQKTKIAQADYVEKPQDAEEGEKKKKKKKNKKKRKGKLEDNPNKQTENLAEQLDRNEQELKQQLLLEQQRSDNDDLFFEEDGQYFDDNYDRIYERREEILQKYSEDDVVSTKDIHIQLEDQTSINNTTIKVNLVKCKQSAFGSPQVDQARKLAQSCAAAIITSVDPVIRLDDQQTEEEIPEELPQPEEEANAQPSTLSKKAQLKADKKKEAKLKAQQKMKEKKQNEAEMKAQKEAKRKEKKAQLQSQQDIQIADESTSFLMVADKKEVKLPGLDVLNSDHGNNQKTKKVQFQRDTSYDGSNKIPKRGSSRGTSVASSTKNVKEDQLLDEIDGLFAKEYKTPQQHVVDSLNNSKKNTPDNSSSKTKPEYMNLNDQILKKKLEDLNVQQFKTQEKTRSSSVPVKEKDEVQKEKSGIDAKSTKPTEIPLNESIPGIEVVKKESKPKKEKSQKDKKLITEQLYSQILPQSNIEIIKPEQPKPAAKKEKKKKQQTEAALAENSQVGQVKQQTAAIPGKKSAKKTETMTAGPVVAFKQTEEANASKNNSNKKKKQTKSIIPEETKDQPVIGLTKQIKTEPAISKARLQQLLANCEEETKKPSEYLGSKQQMPQQFTNWDYLEQQPKATNEIQTQPMPTSFYPLSLTNQIQIPTMETLQQSLSALSRNMTVPTATQASNGMQPPQINLNININTLTQNINYMHSNQQLLSQQMQLHPHPAALYFNSQQKQASANFLAQNFNAANQFQQNYLNMQQQMNAYNTMLQQQQTQFQQKKPMPPSPANNMAANFQQYQMFLHLMNQQHQLQQQSRMSPTQGWQMQYPQQQPTQQQQQQQYVAAAFNNKQRQIVQEASPSASEPVVFESKLTHNSSEFIPQRGFKPFVGIPAEQPKPPQMNMFTQNHSQQYLQQMQMLSQIYSKIQELASQGFVIPNSLDYDTLVSLNPQELSFVPQFYEVLDAQVIKIRHDQEIKLKKAQQLRDIAFNLIKEKINQVYKSKLKPSSTLLKSPVKIEIYGSMATGLAIDSSDLDILVHGFIDPNSPRYYNMTREDLVDELQRLHTAINDVFAIRTNQLIESATVPVIKLQMDLVKICEREKEKSKGFKMDPEFLDDETKVLNIDITLNEPKKGQDYQQHLGVQCCNYIKKKLEEYPNLKILALLFKKFLSLKNMNKPFSGGISSYSLIQMILAVLKLEEYSNQKQNISVLFKKFLWRYGCAFNSQETSISQDCQFCDKNDMNYILHSIQCNINMPIQGIGGSVCTCGYTFMNNQRDSQQEMPQPHQDMVTILKNLLNPNTEDPVPELQQKPPRHTTTPFFSQPTLIIIDPLNKFNNIGKSSYNFLAIQSEFKEVYLRFKDELVHFVKSCSQKQNQGGTLVQYNVDNLVYRIMQIDYKLATPAPIVDQSPPPIAPRKTPSPKEEEKKKTSPKNEQIKPQIHNKKSQQVKKNNKNNS